MSQVPHTALSPSRRLSRLSVAASAWLLFAAASGLAQTPAPPVCVPEPAPAKATAPAAAAAASPAAAAPHADQQGIDASVADDAQVAAALASYRARVAELEKPIARLAASVEKRGIGGGTVGNFVTDAVRAEAARRLKRRINLAVLNTGGMRKNQIAAGTLTSADIYELAPFENFLVVVELTGEQLLRLLSEVTKARDAQSGALVTFAADADDRNPRLIEATLGDARRSKAIKPNKIYTVVTLDYLINRGGNYGFLKEARSITELNVMLRDAIIEHLRQVTAQGRAVSAELDGRFRRSPASAAAPAAQTTTPAAGGSR